MLRIWAENAEFDDTLLSPCILGTRLDVCSFYWSFVCSFLRASRHLSMQPESIWHRLSCCPPSLGSEHTCITWAIPASHTKAALLCQNVFAGSEQERSHINTVTQLPLPTQVSKTSWSPFAGYGLSSQAGRSECTQLYAVGTALFFFFNTVWLFLQAQVKPGLEVLKKQQRNGELTKNQSGEFSISARLHTGIW